MINLFDIENNVVIPTVHCHIIPELKAVIDKYKERSTLVFAYLFYTTYIGRENPYSNIDEVSREDMVKKDLKYDIADCAVINAAREKIKKLYETPTMRFYVATKKTLDKLTEYLDRTQITDGRNGNLDDVMKIMKDYDKIRNTFKNISNDLNDEQDLRTRGDIELSYDQHV